MWSSSESLPRNSWSTTTPKAFRCGLGRERGEDQGTEHHRQEQHPVSRSSTANRGGIRIADVPAMVAPLPAFQPDVHPIETFRLWRSRELAMLS